MRERRIRLSSELGCKHFNLNGYVVLANHTGHGGFFWAWLSSAESGPYNSWGNGSAMRVSPIGFAFDSSEAVLEQTERCAAVTHNHPEGLKRAQATAMAVFLARSGASKEEIKAEISRKFEYDLDRTLDEIRPGYVFDVSCQGSVPESLVAFLVSEDVEDAIRNAISLGGDSDTIACISGTVAHAYYRTIPPPIITRVRSRLPEDLLAVVDHFNSKFGVETGLV